MKDADRKNREGKHVAEHHLPSEGQEREPDRRRFLKKAGMLAAGGAAVYSIPGTVQAASGTRNLSPVLSTGAGLAFNHEDTGPATIAFLHDDYNEGIIDPDDVIVEYRGVSVSSGQALSSAVASLPPPEEGDPMPMEVIKGGVGDPIPVVPLAAKVSIEETLPVTFEDRSCEEHSVGDPAKNKYLCSEESIGEFCLLSYQRKVEGQGQNKKIFTRTVCTDSSGTHVGDWFECA